MSYLQEFTTLLPLITTWVQTTDGTNTLFALICAGALIGAPAKLCIGVTLLLHLALIFA